MKHITAEVQNLNTINLRTHLRSSDTVSRHQKKGFVETGGVGGVAAKATESGLLVPGAVVSLDYLEVSPTKLLHRMRQGLSALLAWQQVVLGKGPPEHLTVEASLCPSLTHW